MARFKSEAHRAECFWRKIAKSTPDECWLWLGQISDDGYGQVKFKYRTWRAHRLAFVLSGGIIPDGMLVLHSCDTPLCCNPSHLRAGTAKDNTGDMISRGRKGDFTGPRPSMQGENHHQSKLNDSDVRSIRSRRDRGELAVSVAADFGISKYTVYRIHWRKAWAHVV